MIIVDTSVWIEFLEGGNHWTKERLKKKIAGRESVAYTEFILLEILTGLKRREDREKVEKNFQTNLLLTWKRSTTMLAAEIYQEMRRKGKTIRSMVDCLISAVAIETGATILHKDRDFEYIAEYYPVVTEKE
jgi:predicted nucleic acid-binding protein